MKNNVFRLLTGCLFLIAAISCNTASKQENEQVEHSGTQPSEISHDYQIGDRVPNELVCMVNDAFMGKPQIPVPVNGKTYYGCCQMCVQKLNEQENARTAIDPHSGKKIDKVDAYIVLLDEKGAVGYFESQKNSDDWLRK